MSKTEKLKVDESVSESVVSTQTQAITLSSASLVKMDEIRKDVALLKEDYSTMPDLSVKEGMTVAKQRYANLKRFRLDGDQARKDYQKPILEEVTRTNNFWSKDVLPEITSLEKQYKDAIDAEKTKIEDAKREKEEAETNRKNAIRARLMEIDTKPSSLIDIESIDAYTATLEAIDLPSFEEFSTAATVSIHNAKEVLANRRSTLAAQAEEARLLEEQKAKQAEEQGRIDAQKEEQRKADEARAKEQADFEKEKAQFAADKLADKKTKELAEENRVKSARGIIADVESLPGRSTTLVLCEASLSIIETYKLVSYAEFNELFISTVDKTVALINAKREELLEADKAATAKAAKDAEDARLFEIQQQKEEAQRIAAMQPELERVRNFLEGIQSHNLPVIESPEIAEVMKVYDDAISKMEEMLIALEMKKAA